jgi:transposase
MIEALQSEVQELRSEVEALRAENVELQARLCRDSSNSSQPPSSDPPWKAPNERKKKGRRRGGQPGHRGHKRKLVEPDHVIDHRPSACRHCGECLQGDDPEPLRHQVTEIPETRATVTEHRVHVLRCGHCQKPTAGVLPHDVPRSAFGPRLQAIIAVCSGAYRLSKRSIEELMRDFFGVTIALGSISNVEQYVSKALAAPVEEAIAHVRNSRVAHLDESPWYERSMRAWLWTAVTSRVAVFFIRGSRSRDVALELLDLHYRGIIVADGYAAYNWINPARRQHCWAHLIRQFRELELYPDAKEFAGRLLAATEQMFERWHRARDGTLAAIGAAMAPSRDEIHALLDEGAGSSSRRVRSLCKQLLKREQSLWTFTRRKYVEPTNNTAERALRSAVLWRKSSFGTDSAKGSRFVERILTVVTSLRMQGRHVLGYITDACRSVLTRQVPAPIWVHP